MAELSMAQALSSMRASRAERASVRPWWFGQQRVLDAGLLWSREPLGSGWSLQRHRVHGKLLRLVERGSGRLAGWGLDEDFLRDELWPLQTQSSGCLSLAHIENKKRIRLAHLSDLHTCWRKHDTLEGASLDPGVLADLARSLQRHDIDLLLVSGDLTDNGLGYMKLHRAFWPWIKTGRFVAVPGNHDLGRLGLTRMASAHKAEDWAAFARLSMGPGHERRFALRAGCWIVAGLDSSGSDLGASVADNAIGGVDLGDLRWLEQRFAELESGSARARVLLVHHHVEVPPWREVEHGQLDHGSLSFLQLSNAGRVRDLCRRLRVDLLLHGHKHIGYDIASSEVPGMRIVSAPSSALARRYAIIELGGGSLVRREVMF